ncbi:hypothetical protein HYH03_008174 [Edaphochlamys debaryana]|uniref:SRCR domain-containing protein n=1 Tax=Edaphochlamys debaryana TaxID=47281 RepID=A0A836BZR0_9CHLO|nr:hypothetical protein HYH03_008174 [Edaphochlamys debaryana]|eukprot:KAG2493659.1 hypothetical protein HYH03_008174 [Edaphochlamys debaryana]
MPVMEPLPIRLVGGKTSAEGVVQVYSAAADEWGSFCVPAITLKGVPGQDQDVAKLICRGLGLPWHGARLMRPEGFNNSEDVSPMSWRAMAVTSTPKRMCYNSPSAHSVLDCQGLKTFVAKPPVNCNFAARLMIGKLKYNYLPAAVSCREVAQKQAPPPSPPPPLPPLAKMGTSVNYTTRIVHPVTGTEYGPDGSRVSHGRLEVLLAGPGDGEEPVWGTVCAFVHPPKELAQYACRAAGLPWAGAHITRSEFAPRLAPKTMPVHWFYVEHCRLDPKGLACALTANWEYVAGLLQDARYGLQKVDPAVRMRLKASLDACDGSVKGHVMDAVVMCEPGEPSMPPHVEFPAPPAPPPSPPLAFHTDVRLKADEVFDGVYMVKLGVRNGSSYVYGTVCNNDMSQSVPPGLDRSAAAAVCHQLTNGAKPYGAWSYIESGTEYNHLPTSEERQAVPWVATGLDCTAVPVTPRSPPVWVGDLNFVGSAPNVTACRLTGVPKPIGKELPRECSNGAWSHRLLTCNTVDMAYPPYILGVRLAGGNDSSWGRLEVVMPGLGIQDGFGTVCAQDFGIEHAQAVCRDLGMGWTKAKLLPPTAVNASKLGSLPIALEALECPDLLYPLYSLGDAAPFEARSRLSFVRDCREPSYRNSYLPLCDHTSDVVLACGGDSPPLPRLSPSPPPAPSPAPAYGSSGSALPPVYPPPDHVDDVSPPVSGGLRRALRR